MALLRTAEKRPGLILLSLSLFGPLVFGVYQDFLAIGPDHVHWQPANAGGTKIALTAYLLLITEAIGTYFIVHFLWIAPDNSSKAAEVRFR
jgi:hypothetical protein